MFNFSYFKSTMKSNAAVWGAFTAVLCLFLCVIINIFTPSSLEGITGAVKGTGAANLISGGTLIAFLSNFYYAIMAIIFPMLYLILVGNNLIAKKVDDGSMAGYLSTPVSRLKIVVTSAVCYLFYLALMWVIVSGIGIAVAGKVQPGSLDTDTFLMMNVGAFLYHFTISSICFFASCVCNSTKTSLIIGGGIPLAFFVISLLVKLSDSLENLKYLTLNTLFDTSAILRGDGYGLNFAIMAIAGILLYTIGILIFRKRNLPL